MKSALSIFLDHDGGVDDLLSLLLLLTEDAVDLRGVVVTPADCYPDYAIEASRKILDLMGKSSVTVARSEVRGINAFPPEWRAQPHIINALPQLLNLEQPKTPLSHQQATSFMVDCIQSASLPVTYLMTGPCTTLVQALKEYPALRENIGHIVWMAGAVEVPGNVVTYTHNQTAEWNVYWDAVSAQWLLQQELPLTIVPLDATNHVPVSFEFLKKLARLSSYEVAHFASICWATTINAIPSYEYLYHMWDVLATAYVLRPDLFSTQQRKITIATAPPNEGQTMNDEKQGVWTNMVDTVELEAFYQYLLDQHTVNFVKAI